MIWDVIYSLRVSTNSCKLITNTNTPHTLNYRKLLAVGGSESS